MIRSRSMAFVAFLLLPVALSATTLVKLDVEEMSRLADAVLIGRCVSQESVWINGQLMTLTRMDVEEIIKGPKRSSVTVALPGGADHKRQVPIAQVWPDAPRIEVGERKLLFLEQGSQASAAFSVLGYSQGLFSIVPGDGGTPMASQDLSGVALVTSGGATEMGRQNALPLTALKERILRAAPMTGKEKNAQ